MMSTISVQQTLKIGDQVIFDKSRIDEFKAETSSEEKPIKQYQQLVLGGVDQVGTIKSFEGNLTTVIYPDGWELPVPTKYLILNN